jgi:hypothetical protein
MTNLLVSSSKNLDFIADVLPKILKYLCSHITPGMEYIYLVSHNKIFQDAVLWICQP